MRGHLPELVDCLPHFPDFVLELADQRVRGHVPEPVDCLRGECHSTRGCHPDHGEDLAGFGLPVRGLAGLPGDVGEHHCPMVRDRPDVLLLGVLGEGSWEITQ